MAIDVRAKVQTNIGPLVSASVSDSFIQEAGLIFTTGEVVLDGLFTITQGTLVTIQYKPSGAPSFKDLPRRLLALGSFIDPYRRTTTVQLGCPLTYKKDLKPAPEPGSGDIVKDTGIRQQCVNGYVEYPATATGIPIDANICAQYCLSKLGLSGSTGLTNKFYIDSFDYSPGYVTVLGDLLVSESRYGYVNQSGAFVTNSLETDGSNGPVLTDEKIIDIGPLGYGEPSANSVIVRYTNLVLKEEEAQGEEQKQIQNWELEKTEAASKEVLIEYSTKTAPVRVAFQYYPYSEKYNEYGSSGTPDDVCVLVGNAEPDLSNSVIYSKTKVRQLYAEQCGKFIKALLEAPILYPSSTLLYPDAKVLGGTTADQITEEFIQYDSKGLEFRREVITYEPFFAWIGRLDLELVTKDVMYVPGLSLVMTKKVVTETETIYAKLPYYVQYDWRTEEIERLVNGQKVKTYTYETWCSTQQGQQYVAENKQYLARHPNFFLEFVFNLQRMTLNDVVTQIDTKRIVSGYSRRPKRQINEKSAEVTEESQQLSYIFGAGIPDTTVLEFEMPYQSTDYYNASGQIIPGDQKSKATAYGNIQNKIRYGTKYGMNIQTHPDYISKNPFSYVNVTIGGATATYRVNGLTFTANAEGLIAGFDGVYWGAVGAVPGVTDYWFPVAPGVTVLPVTPSTIPDPEFGEILTTDALVPPFEEIINFNLTVRTKISIAVFPNTSYVEVIINLTIRSRLILSSVPLGSAVVDTPSHQIFKIYPKIPSIGAGGAIEIPNLLITLTINAVQVSSGVNCIVPVSSISIAALQPSFVGQSTPSSALISVGTSTIQILPLVPAIGGGTIVNVTSTYSTQITVSAPYVDRQDPQFVTPEGFVPSSAGASTYLSYTADIINYQYEKDDIIIAAFEVNPTYVTTITDLAAQGWTLVPGFPVVQGTTTSATALHVYWKRYTGTGGIGFTSSQTYEHYAWVVTVIKNARRTGNFYSQVYTGSGISYPTIPSITTTTTNPLLLAFFGTSGYQTYNYPINLSNTVKPNLFLRQVYTYTTSGTDGGIVVYTGLPGLPAPTGSNIAYTLLTDQNYTYAVFEIPSY